MRNTGMLEKIRRIKRNTIIGSIVASILAAIAAALYFWKSSGKKISPAKNSTDSSDLTKAADSYISALSRLLEEAGISDDRERDRRPTKEKTGSRDSRNVADYRNPQEGIAEILNEMNMENSEDLLTNERIAQVVLQLIGLRNLVDPGSKVDVKNIHFVDDGNDKSMVIEMHTSTYGAPAYDDELAKLWAEVFPANDFWNEDFSKIRINVKEAGTEQGIETVLCKVDDLRRFICKEINEEQFQSRCKHKKAKNRKNKIS
ncbi:MAG: hypothetical protein HY779_06285 [Rubrobacteridae bacterium]|nr:hypothetical protein [Rubrobacteridae bacterium]